MPEVLLEPILQPSTLAPLTLPATAAAKCSLEDKFTHQNVGFSNTQCYTRIFHKLESVNFDYSLQPLHFNGGNIKKRFVT